MAKNKDKNRHEYLLLVEGATEKRAIPELVEANGISWEIKDEETNKKKFVVYIDDLGGVDRKQKIQSAEISNELNVASREVVGLIVDADDSCISRYKSKFLFVLVII